MTGRRPAPAFADARLRGEQGARVGVRRVRVDAVDRALLDDAPGVHDGKRVANPASTPKSWLTITTAMPRSSDSRRSKSITWALMVTSRAVVGSSARSSGGSQASARAMATRCRIPPEN